MRRIAFAFGLVLAAGGLTACGQDPPQVTVQAPTLDTGLPSGVTVQGKGVVSGKPDTLTVDIGVSLQRATVSDAVGAAAERTDAVIAALEANGVTEADLQTRNYSVTPSFRYENDRTIPDGYRVTNTVSAKLHDLAAAGATIDAATAAGGDDVQVQGVSFSLEDDVAALAQARQKAFEDARGKAEQYAGLGGRALGPVEAISDVVVTPTPFTATGFAARDAAESTPVEAGTVDTTVTVSARFPLG